jgi:hypothetical protein
MSSFAGAAARIVMDSPEFRCLLEALGARGVAKATSPAWPWRGVIGCADWPGID